MKKFDMIWSKIVIVKGALTKLSKPLWEAQRTTQKITDGLYGVDLPIPVDICEGTGDLLPKEVREELGFCSFTLYLGEDSIYGEVEVGWSKQPVENIDSRESWEGALQKALDELEKGESNE